MRSYYQTILGMKVRLKNEETHIKYIRYSSSINLTHFKKKSY